MTGKPHLVVIAVAVALAGVLAQGADRSLFTGPPSHESTQVSRLEHITGPAAVAYLATKSRAVPGLMAAYAKSDAELRAMGFKKTDTVVVVRRYRPAAALASARSPFQRVIAWVVPNLHAQTASESNGYGEVVYTSWDDGDDGTWEGQQFFQDYADGYWELTNLREDINEEPVVLSARLSGSRDGRERDRQGLQPAQLMDEVGDRGEMIASGPVPVMASARPCSRPTKSPPFVSTRGQRRSFG